MDIDRMLNLEVIFRYKSEATLHYSQFDDRLVDYLNRDGLVLKTQISVTLKER